MRAPAASAPSTRSRALWLALATPPAAWFVALNAAYFSVDWACRSPAGEVFLHAALALTLAAAAGAGVWALHAWRRLGGAWPGAADEGRERARLLTVLAGASGALFSLIIVLQWLAVVTLGPCEPAPHLRFSPGAAHERAGPALAASAPGGVHPPPLATAAGGYGPAARGEAPAAAAPAAGYGPAARGEARAAATPAVASSPV